MFQCAMSGALLTALFSIIWKGTATAAVMVSAGRLALRLGPILTGVLISIPLNAGPGFFILSFDVDAAFLSTAGLFGFAVAGPVLIFSALTARLLLITSLLPALLGGLAAWAAGVWLLTLLPMTIWLACLSIIVSALLSWRLGRLPAGTPEIKQVDVPAGWRFLLLRSAIAGGVIASVATIGPYLAPFWSGLLFGFPTTLCANLWMLNGHYGRVFAARTLLASRINQSAYATLCLVLWLGDGLLPATLGVVVAFLAGMSVAGLVAIILHRRRSTE